MTVILLTKSSTFLTLRQGTLSSVSGVISGAIYESDNEAMSCDRTCVLLEMSKRIRGASIQEVRSDQVGG